MSFGMDSSPILRFVAQLRAEKAGTKTPKDRTRSPETKPKQPLRGCLGFAEASLLGMTQEAENACLKPSLPILRMLVPMLCVDTSEATDRR